MLGFLILWDFVVLGLLFWYFRLSFVLLCLSPCFSLLCFLVFGFLVREALVQGVSPCSAEDPAMARCGAHGKIRPVVLPSGS